LNYRTLGWRTADQKERGNGVPFTHFVPGMMGSAMPSGKGPGHTARGRENRKIGSDECGHQTNKENGNGSWSTEKK